MTNRREFLHLGVAALSLPIAARAGASSAILAGSGEQSEEPRREPLYKILFDERYLACARFAQEIERGALATHAIRADITKLWYDDLYHRWNQGAVAIAGLTAPGPIFCLEMLARDAGMRVALRVDHRRSGQRIDHEFAGPVESLMLARELETSSERWPEKMAKIVARFPAKRTRATTGRYSGRTDRNCGEWEHLVTWVIVPVSPQGKRG